MPDLSGATLSLLLALIVPGFVWMRVHRYLQVSEPAPGESWLGCFSLSAMNFAIWSWLIPSLWIATDQAIESRSEPSNLVYACWFVVAFVSPFMLGLLSGFATRRNWLRLFLVDRLRLAIRSPIASAWDHVFGSRSAEGILWASVTLLDGSVVEGLFGAQSLASSRESERDLYLEAHFRQDSNGTLVPVADSAGIWINSTQIKAIEFKWVQTTEVAP